MPIYEYVCQDCRGPFEKLVRRFDEAVACPHCSSAAVDKQLSVFAVASAAAAPAFAGCGAGPCGTADAPCGGGSCGLPS